VLVEVTEAGSFPAAESVVADRHWDRNIDPYHANLHPRCKVACCAAIIGHDRHPIAVFMIINQP